MAENYESREEVTAVVAPPPLLMFKNEMIPMFAHGRWHAPQVQCLVSVFYLYGVNATPSLHLLTGTFFAPNSICG